MTVNHAKAAGKFLADLGVHIDWYMFEVCFWPPVNTAASFFSQSFQDAVVDNTGKLVIAPKRDPRQAKPSKAVAQQRAIQSAISYAFSRVRLLF